MHKRCQNQELPNTLNNFRMESFSVESYMLSPEDPEVMRLVKAADKLCAYLKAVREVVVGNREFAAAKTALREQLKALAPEGGVPEVEHFLREFEHTFTLSLDELQAHDERAD